MKIIEWFLLIIVILLMSCTIQTNRYFKFQNKIYLSVKSFGAKGNGKKDDRLAIQKALNSGNNIFFPKGNYLLESKTTTEGILLMTENNYSPNLYFEKGAILTISSKQPKDYIKPAILLIWADKGIIESVKIDGMTIEGNRQLHAIKNSGLVAYERKGASIKKLYLNNITIKNVGGGGIHTQARHNKFVNIKTENCGSHGIGVINTTNRGIESYFFLDGYTSLNDDAYSIDFSGPEKNKVAKKGYSWKGTAKNIKSINSFYGIKTAGYWNLDMENVLIENSHNNGFFINHDAPGKILNLANITIINAKDNGMSLGGEITVNTENIKILGCKVGLSIDRARVKFNGLIIDGENKNTATIRMGKYGGEIKNFTIKNSSKTDQYPIWVRGENVLLENGEFLNNQSVSEIIIHENARNVILKKLKFGYDDSINKGSKKNAIINIQKYGSTKIIDCDFSKIEGKKIDDRSKRIEILNAKGL